MNQSKSKKVQTLLANLKEDNFVNHFYIDYFGGAAIGNGERFRPSNLKIESSYEVESTDDQSVTYLFAVSTNSGQKGMLVFYSSDPNFESEMNFVEKCKMAA